MTEEILALLSKQLNKCISHVNEKVARNENQEPIAYTVRRNLLEIGEALFCLIDSDLLTKYDEAVVRRSFGECHHLLHEKLIHFGSYNSSYQILVHGEALQKDEILRRTNVETATMLLSIRGFLIEQVIIGDSTDDYFLERMEKLLKGIKYIIDKKVSEYYLPIFYNLLNLYRTITIFLQSGHKKYTELLQKRQLEVWDLIERIKKTPEIADYLKGNLQLQLFDEYCLLLHGNEAIISPNISLETVEGLTITQKTRVALNIVDIGSPNCLTIVEKALRDILAQRTIVIPESALVIRLCIAYLKLHAVKNFELDIQVRFEDIDAEAILHKYIKGYDKIGETDLSDGDLNILNQYNDEKLREIFASCIQGVDANELEMEKRKPHGVSEIADMELRIKYGDHKIYWCMPFKSGAEIAGNSVPVKIAYQIFRPFFHLNSCSVLFVTAKKCSENLMNEIKRGKDKFNFSIAVIQEHQLAKLLKINQKLN